MGEKPLLSYEELSFSLYSPHIETVFSLKDQSIRMFQALHLILKFFLLLL